MKERPIIFNSEMVRAILQGRKTQTRRPIKGRDVLFLDQFFGAGIDKEDEQSEYDQIVEASGIRVWLNEYPEEGSEVLSSPFGLPGDRLWVREAWYQLAQGLHNKETDRDRLLGYVADGDHPHGVVYRVRPSIHMPRWASRITLEITNVRVERLQDIREEDAKAEGVAPLFDAETQRKRPECRSDEFLNYLWHGNHGNYGLGNKKSDAWPYQFSGYEKAKDSFSSLWELIYGRGSWDKNPWVWAVEFKRI